MIFTDRTIIVQKGISSINDTIILYRGDKGVEIRFTLNEGSPFRFGSGASPNIIEKTEAAYGQLIIKRPNDLPAVFSGIAPTNEGKIVFTITAEMIDEITEVGNYTFQIRLLDENKESRVTIPEVVNGIEIREPIASEDATNEVGVATVGYAVTTAGTTEDTFDSQGNYNKTTWGTGDRITAAKLNKMEAGIDGVNKKVANINNINDTTASATTTYSSNKIENIKENLSSQIKEIVKVADLGKNGDNIYIKDSDGNKIGNGITIQVSSSEQESSSVSKMSIPKIIGQIFEKPKGRKYVAWALGNAEYDSSEDTVNVLINSCDVHDRSGDPLDLYLFKMNAKTLDYELIEIVVGGQVVNQSNSDTTFTTSNGAYTYGFCIDKDGNYLFLPNYLDTQYLFKSTDKGRSWNVSVASFPNSNDNSYTGLMQTSTGRLIVSTHSSYFWYSDDGGINWTKCSTPTDHSFGHEATIVELKTNQLIAVMRKRWQSTDNNSWNGNREIDAAFICYSYDNGATWTNGIDSTTITEMSASGCAIALHKDEGIVELYATSRYPHGDKYGAVIQHYATIDNAMNDNWSTGKIITYSNALSYDDFGYPSCCVDNLGNTHLFYYDGDDTQAGSTNYYYIQCIKDVDNFPINCDTHINPSIYIPYSAKQIEKKISELYAKLNSRINEIIINNGGTIEDKLDGSFYVTDNLIAYWNTMASDEYDTSTHAFIDKINNLNMVLYTNDSLSTNYGYADDLVTDQGITSPNTHSGYCIDSPASYITDTAIFTLEYAAEVLSTSTVETGGIWRRTNNSTSSDKYIANNQVNISYVNTSGSTIAYNKSYSNMGWSDAHLKSSTGGLVIHVVVNTNAISIYKNGALMGTVNMASIVSDFSSLTNALEYGLVFRGIGYALKGFKIYNKALSIDEIKNNYNYEKNRLGL